jgi:outer membrane protein assembly factor BamB
MMRWHPFVGGFCLTGLVLLALTVGGEAAGQDKDKVLPLEIQWRRPILMDKNDFTGDADPGQAAKAWVDKALTARGEAALVPGLRPLVIGDRLVVRTYDDARVLSLVDEKAAGTKAGGIVWVGAPGERGLVALLDREPAGLAAVTTWLSKLPQADLAEAIVENGLAGALSHDGQRVFWVDSLTVPAQGPQPPVPIKGKRKKDAVESEQEPDEMRGRQERNVLWAIDLKTGKIAWRAGLDSPAKQDPFGRSHFLGVPCVVKDQLYALNETNEGALRLVVLEPARGAVKSMQALDSVAVAQRFMSNARRQVHAAQVVADPSVVVCVPHAGKVFGVEPQGQKVRWTYDYGSVMPAVGGPHQLGFWKDSAAHIHDGKVVFTTADSEEVHCLNLEDGRMLWKKRPPDGLYLAGILGDKVLVACKSGFRALAIKDGQEVWHVETGSPSGLGVFAQSIYLLPVKLGATSKTPQIVYLDAEQGRIVGTSPLKEMPGNLALCRDQIVSVSATTVTALTRAKP